MNFNKAVVVGRLVRDPEKRTTDGGLSVTKFSLVTSHFYKDKSGENKDVAEFHNIVFFGRTADVAAQYLKKGSIALVEGRIQTGSWEDKEGNKRYRTEIIGERLQLGPRPAEGGGTQGRNENSENSKFTGEEQSSDKEIPVIDEDDEINVEDIPF